MVASLDESVTVVDPQGPPEPFATDAFERAAVVQVRHHDDALDAYQRALEIFVRRVETVDPATEVAWLKVVIRHEAMAIRRARSEPRVSFL